MVVLLGNRRADICWGNEALRFDYFVFSIAVFAQVNLFRLSCLNGRLDTHKIFKISSGFVAILSCPLRFNIGRRVDSRFWRWCGYDSSVLSIYFFFFRIKSWSEDTRVSFAEIDVHCCDWLICIQNGACQWTLNHHRQNAFESPTRINGHRGFELRSGSSQLLVWLISSVWNLESAFVCLELMLCLI